MNTKADTDFLLWRPKGNEGDEFAFSDMISRPLRTPSSVFIRVHPWLIFFCLSIRRDYLVITSGPIIVVGNHVETAGT